MAKYLITGGCGFIGSHLTAKLITMGHKVLIIDNLSNATTFHPQAEFIQSDITQLDSIHDLFKTCDGCFHLAAIPTVEMEFDDWFSIHQVNLTGSLNVFKSAIDAGKIPVVYASSCGVYGNTKKLPLREDHLIKPISAYGCDKLATELNAYFLEHIYQLPSMGLRLFNVYGPGQSAKSPYSGVITNFITQIAANDPVTIYGTGEQTRDFVYVADVVANMIRAIDSLKTGAQIVNICTGKSTTINQLVETISNLMNKKHTRQFITARSYDTANSYGDIEKMKSLGFIVNNSLEQGLEKTIDFLSQNNSIDK